MNLIIVITKIKVVLVVIKWIIIKIIKILINK